MDIMEQKLNGRGISMGIFHTAEMKYQQLNSFYNGASLPVKMLFMLAIGVVLLGTFSVILPPVYKMGQEFGAYLHNVLNK